MAYICMVDITYKGVKIPVTIDVYNRKYQINSVPVEIGLEELNAFISEKVNEKITTLLEDIKKRRNNKDTVVTVRSINDADL